MHTKAKGTRNEHRSMALLESAGYACTRPRHRSACSTSSGSARLTSCSCRLRRLTGRGRPKLKPFAISGAGERAEAAAPAGETANEYPT